MQKSNTPYPLSGGCDCKLIRYRLLSPPLIVNCCHCRWCQRETGSAFVLNAVIEASRITIPSPSEPEIIKTPSESGRGQLIARCPDCKIAVWSQYGDPGLRYVRVGTLDHPDCCPPDVHIFTKEKQKWLVLPEGIPVFEEYFEEGEVWSKESLGRLEEVRKGGGDGGG